MVEGSRRIGNSTTVEDFTKQEYESYILIDFAKKDKVAHFEIHPIRNYRVKVQLALEFVIVLLILIVNEM